LDVPEGEWFLIESEVTTGGEREVIENLYEGDFLSSNVFTQFGADGIFPEFMTDAYGNMVAQ